MNRRTRLAWVARSDEVWNRGVDAAADRELARQVNGEPSSMILLPVHDEALDDAVPQEVWADVSGWGA